MNKKQKRILIGAIITLIIIIILNTESITAYGVIKNSVFNAQVKDCEVYLQEYNLLIPTSDKEGLINGLLIFKQFIFTSINKTYDYKIACKEFHEEDIELTLNESLEKTINSGVEEIIEYEVKNNQDKRLFYESRIYINCSVERRFFTGYLNPNETNNALFKITCEPGNHTGRIDTVFMDELSNTHDLTTSLVINSVTPQGE